MSRWAMIVDIEPVVDPSVPNLRMRTGVSTALTGQAYRANAIAEGGIPPYTYSSATLPAWAKIDPSTGEIIGTPSGGPAYTEVEIQVQDALGTISTIVVAIHVIDSISLGGMLAPAEEGIAYSSKLTAIGTTGLVAWAMTGTIPGLSINVSTGVISGTPTTAGTFPVTISATDSTGATTRRAITFKVAAPLQIGGPAVPYSYAVGAYIEFQRPATDGVRPYLYEIDPSYPLPPGMRINRATGVISGIPTVPFGGTVLVRVTDFVGATDTSNFTLNVVQAYSDASRIVVRSFTGNNISTSFTISHPFDDNGLLNVQVTRRLDSPSRREIELVDCVWNTSGGAVTFTFATAPSMFDTFDVFFIGTGGSP